MICTCCGERSALRDVGLCRTCASVQERADRRERPDYYHARTKAAQIDLGDVHAAKAAWAAWASRMDSPADTEHDDIGRRVVASLDGVRFHAGVIVAVARGSSLPGRERKRAITAYWVWLLKPPEELVVPMLRFDLDGVEIIRRERVAEVGA